MIEVAGEWWGTAAEIADHIGQGLKPHTIRWWARNDGLARVRATDADGRPQVRYLLGQAIIIDVAKRDGGRGRKRAG